MPRFVVLRHDTPQGSHFDLMLEAGDVLKTWALPQTPIGSTEMLCVALPDHRPAYLDYEGPISAGRGDVVRWDCGNYVLQQGSDVLWTVDLTGEKLVGLAILRRIADEPTRWRFSFSATPANR